MNENPYRAPRTRSQSSPSLLYKDLANAWITGVCAGIADRFDLSVTVVRMVVLLGMIFLPPITFLSYVVASFILPIKPIDKEKTGYYLRDSLTELEIRIESTSGRVSQLESYITSQDFEVKTKLFS